MDRMTAVTKYFRILLGPLLAVALAACSDTSTVEPIGTTPVSAATTTVAPEATLETATTVATTTVAPATTTVPTTALPTTTLGAAGVTVLPAVPAIGGSTDDSIVTPDGRTRTYHVYVPSQLPAGPVPLLLAFHGGTGWGQQFERSSGFDGLAEANGFIVVYPDGVGNGADETNLRTWNGGGCCGAAARHNVDDVGFVNQLLDTLEATYSIDTHRVFATGHSNGGILSYRLACELSDRIVGAGLQSGTLEIDRCSPTQPVSLLHIHGTADTNLPIDGGRGADSIAGVDFVSPRKSIGTLAVADGCTTATVEAIIDPTNPDITIRDWTGCTAGAEVKWMEVRGAGHGWMGRTSANPNAAPAYQGLDASLTIVTFLLEHPRPS